MNELKQAYRDARSLPALPHAPFPGPLLSKESAAELMTLLREPRLEARAEGGRAYYTGADNPYPAGSPESVSWDAGYRDERQGNS
jgi:hypothetical protein